MLNDLKILDTTLRDGEQTPGVLITSNEKLRIASKLDELGVDVIEAGSAITSKDEQKSIKTITENKLNAEICSFARPMKIDIDTALDCDVDSIHLVIPSSDLHIDYKLRKTREQVEEMAVNATEYAKSHGLIVELSTEDATRTGMDDLKHLYNQCIEVGADRLCACDTVGILTPERSYEFYKELAQLPQPLSVHCHNDFGLAVANTLAALNAGAQQAHVTINGLGERAGNASLEEIVMSLHKFYDINTNINSKLLVNTSETVSRITGVKMPPNKAIVGENAFAHEAGIHVQGILANSETYEALNPEEVGHKRRIVLGKLTGANAVRAKLDEYNIKLNDEQFNTLFRKIKSLGDAGKTITDLDFRSIAEAIQGKPTEERIKLCGISVMTGDSTLPTATVKLDLDGEIKYRAETGVGPVDAALNAIQSLINEVVHIELEEYHIEAITGGTNALGEVFVITVDENGNKATGRATDEDIVKASIDAILSSTNKLLMLRN